jgi:hypothetical protein
MVRRAACGALAHHFGMKPSALNACVVRSLGMAGASVKAEEELVALKVARDQVPPVSHVRSTLLISSVNAVRERNLFDVYVARLDPRFRDEILSSLAGTWHDIEVALAHYEACEGLGLSDAQQFDIGLEVGKRVQTTLMGTLVKMATGAGVTPWLPLGQCDAFFERLYRGGGVRLAQLGPKEALLELVGMPQARFSYFRTAQRGLIQGGLGLFCTKVYVAEQPAFQPARRHSYRISWV